MQNNLFFSLILNISFLVLIATILTELRPLRMMLRRQDRSLKNQLVLGVIFGLLSISCTYTGLSFQGAVVNTRVVSTVAAGLVGGPASGICAGVLSGVHRYFYNPAGFTSFACAIGTFLFGVIGAVSYRWFTRRSRRTSDLVFITLVAELVQCGLILLLAKPFSAAAALEESILLPKILVNSLGLVAFMRILDRLNRDLTIELAEQQAVALLIAQECLPYLRRGIKDREGLQCAVNIVREKIPHFQVALTDCTQILAASGGLSSAGPLPPSAREAIAQNRSVAATELSGGSGYAGLAAPLHQDEKVIGALLLKVPTGPNLVLDADICTLESLAKFFSVMLELGEAEHQIALRKQAEFRALQSQINPHFLFNALNTISGLCLTDPDRACKTILVLAAYFRQTLTINEPFVTLEQEVSNVDNYLMLTEARFEGELHVECSLPDDLTKLRLPPLILQPIVENAVRHGFVSVDDRRVDICIRQDDERAYIRVSDRGHGFPPEVLRKLEDPNDPTYTGLYNVRKRLRSIYGEQCVFTIDSSEHGSTVAFSIPLISPQMPDIV